MPLGGGWGGQITVCVHAYICVGVYVRDRGSAKVLSPPASILPLVLQFFPPLCSVLFDVRVKHL